MRTTTAATLSCTVYRVQCLQLLTLHSAWQSQHSRFFSFALASLAVRAARLVAGRCCCDGDAPSLLAAVPAERDRAPADAPGPFAPVLEAGSGDASAGGAALLLAAVAGARSGGGALAFRDAGAHGAHWGRGDVGCRVAAQRGTVSPRGGGVKCVSSTFCSIRGGFRSFVVPVALAVVFCNASCVFRTFLQQHGGTSRGVTDSLRRRR